MTPDPESPERIASVYPIARAIRSRLPRVRGTVPRAFQASSEQPPEAELEIEGTQLGIPVKDLLADRQVPRWGEQPDGTGICLSGGGIRSASYCLGALQSLAHHDLLFGENHAKYLSAVSGGSYIATAFTMVTKGRIRGGPSRTDPTITPVREVQAGHPDMTPFAHGSPEERFLRDHTLYLTHGRAGIPGVAWRVLLGLTFNVLIVVLGLASIFLPLGWLYSWLWPILRAGCPKRCPVGPMFSIPNGLWWAVISVSILALVTGFVWLVWRFHTEWTRTFYGAISGFFLGSSIALLLFFVGIPYVIHLARPFYSLTGVPQTAHATKVTTSVVASVGLVGLVGAWIAAASRLLTTPSAIEGDAVKGLRTFARKHRPLLLNIAATIAGPLLVLAGIVVLAYLGSAYFPSISGKGARELWAWAGAVVLLVLLCYQADVTAWSLYPLYRNRLSAGFVLRRIKRFDKSPSPTAVGDQDASERPYSQPYRLSEYQPEQFPEVIICAAANISDYGATPSGSHVTSFTFSSKWIGGPVVGAQLTEVYEKALGDRAQARFTTLPTAMSISGAAFSPSMGKMTHAPFRFFLALANLRLGVWVPNPRRLDKFVGRGLVHQVTPRPQYFLREMLGRNHLDAPFLYITDGGHYENLGLVELLRRKCETIWCIDASGDRVDTFNTLGSALQLAQSELQVSIDINPVRDMVPEAPRSDGSSPQYVKYPFCRGTIRYPDGKKGTLIFVKAGVPRNAPWSITSFARKNPKFPCDPTIDQLYDADRFDAYRELGRFSVEEAAKKWPPESP